MVTVLYHAHGPLEGYADREGHSLKTSSSEVQSDNHGEGTSRAAARTVDGSLKSSRLTGARQKMCVGPETEALMTVVKQARTRETVVTSKPRYDSKRERKVENARQLVRRSPRTWGAWLVKRHQLKLSAIQWTERIRQKDRRRIGSNSYLQSK